MPRQKTAPSDYPQAVLRQIEALAQNIVIARKRRGESQAQWAKKLGISQPTMVRIERGDPSVAMASYVMCIWLINPAAGLADLIAPVHDHAALEQEVARVRAKRKPSDKVKRSRVSASPTHAKEPAASNPTRTSKALATPAMSQQTEKQYQNSLKAAIRSASGFLPETSARGEVLKALEDLGHAESWISPLTVAEAQRLKVIEDLKRSSSGFPPETIVQSEVRKILGDLKRSESGSSATTIFEAQNLKMIEELKRAVLGMNNPSHLTSQAQGMAALLSKSGLKKND